MRLILASKIIIIIILLISSPIKNIVLAKVPTNNSVKLENINNTTLLVLDNSTIHKKSLKLIINGDTVSVTFINGKSYLPKKFLDNTFLSIRLADTSFIHTHFCFVFNIIGKTYVFSISLIKIIIYIAIFLSIVILLKVLFSIFFRIVIPATILVILILFILKPDIIQNDIFNNIKEYKNKIVEYVKNIF